jgi:hypothetical protein
MDVSGAVSEPFAQLSAFHIAFNRNVKLSFGALEAIGKIALGPDGLLRLPTGGEPWGTTTSWRSLDQPVKNAATFLSELGIVRATAAFEDYLVLAKAEFDRAKLVPVRGFGMGTAVLDHLDGLLGINPADIDITARMATFFDVARNCAVHRSNRASPQLAALRAEPAFTATLAAWPRRVGRWTVSLPPIQEGTAIDWRPRHAIMASDAYLRCARIIDRALVACLGEIGLVRMAAHWSFFADVLTPCPAKLDAATIVRTQLIDRHRVRAPTTAQVIQGLRDAEMWDPVLRAFERVYPDGPETAGPRRRRARLRRRVR